MTVRRPPGSSSWRAADCERPSALQSTSAGRLRRLRHGYTHDKNVADAAEQALGAADRPRSGPTGQRGGGALRVPALRRAPGARSSSVVFDGHPRMPLKSELRTKINAMFEDARERRPTSLSTDGSAVTVYGSIGVDAFVSPDGDAFIETYEIGESGPSKVDKSRRGRIAAIVLGATRIPELAELLPPRPGDAVACTKCTETGWFQLGP